MAANNTATTMICLAWFFNRRNTFLSRNTETLKGRFSGCSEIRWGQHDAPPALTARRQRADVGPGPPRHSTTLPADVPPPAGSTSLQTFKVSVCGPRLPTGRTPIPVLSAAEGTKAHRTKSRVTGNCHARFGNGGGGREAPADRN